MYIRGFELFSFKYFSIKGRTRWPFLETRREHSYNAKLRRRRHSILRARSL